MKFLTIQSSTVPKVVWGVVLFFGLFFVSGVERAQAVSWVHSGTYISCGGDDSSSWCFPENTGTLLNITANTNKTTYQPGETMTISMAVYNYLCSNYALYYEITGKVGGQSKTLVATGIGGWSSQYPSNTMTAPTTPGLHTVTLTACTNYLGPVCTTRTIPIMVSTPAAASPTAPAATISGSACTIALGNATCSGLLTWNITNAEAPNVYNSNGTTYSISSSGTNQNVTLRYGVNTIFAQNNSLGLASVNLNTSCDSGLVFDGASCEVAAPLVPPAPQIQISVDRELIRSGDTVEVSMQVTAGYPVSCTLSGVESSPITFIHSPVGGTNTTNYTYTSRPLTSAQVVTLSCVAEPAIAGVGPANAQARINVVPTIQEI